MNRRVAATLLVVLAVVGVSAVPVAGDAVTGVNQVPGSELMADSIEMRVDVGPDGDANWSVSYRVRLATENETAAFESLQEDVRTNASAYVTPFATGINATVAAAENRTSRSMAARDFGVATDTEFVPREYGVVTYRFTWTNFGVVNGERVRTGDALAGLFLDESTRLTVAGPPALAPVEVVPREPAEVRTDSVVWSGPLDFAPGEPVLVFGPPAGTTEPGSTTDRAGNGVPFGGVVAAALIAALIAAGLVLVGYRRLAGASEPAEPAPASGSSAAPDAETATPEPDSEPEPDDELLSNEERVERLLERRGGRVKQQEIVSELDWTEAKTSQVVNAMQESGRIEKFRIGRENVVKLPDESE